MNMAKLTVAKLAKLPPGRHGDGDGLWLQIRPGNHRSWLFSYTSPITGKVRSMGLGPAGDVPLKMARELAQRARGVVREGIDPLEAREAAKAQAVAAAGKAEASAITFSQAAHAYIVANQAAWRGVGHRMVPDFMKRRPDVSTGTIEQYLHNLYEVQPDFLYSVSRDFIRNCRTPMLVLPDDVPGHPLQTSIDVASLSPKAEITVLPWKEPEELKQRTIDRVDWVEAEEEVIITFHGIADPGMLWSAVAA
jgi:hypothetical protein